MKMIMAIIKPHRLEKVKDALKNMGVQGVTVTEVKGFGRQKGYKEVYRETEYFVDLLPKVKLEIAVEDKQVEQVTQAISENASTGNIGDGKVFVLPLENALRIRTQEEGDKAL